jgi:serine/threonine protein kinase
MDDLQPSDPDSVGGYRLVGRLGAGGMGQVFLGVSPGGRKVAVKLIHPVHAGASQFRERFAREIEAAQLVGGFHTAPVVDADPHADPPWMVTAYIDGPSLQEAVDGNGPLPPDQTRALGAGLAEGLAAIHARGLVHRDLKPGNVILATDGPRIIDFGIARAADATTGITTAGAVVGTFAFMSPEHVRGEATGPSSDVFSLGCVLAFAATGRPPFGSDSAAPVMFRVVSQSPDLAGLADSELAGLISGCLAKVPEDRPTVLHLLTALSSPYPAPARADAPGDAAQAAAGEGTPTQTHAPAPRQTGPDRQELLPLPAVEPAKPPTSAAAKSAQRRRRWPRRRSAALIAVAAVAAGIAISLPFVFTRGAVGASASHRPLAVAGVSVAVTTPSKNSPSLATRTRSSTPEPTASSPSQAISTRTLTPEPATSTTIVAGPTRPQLASVPNTIGDTETKATQVLEAAGFKVKVNTFGQSAKVFDYAPVGQRPRGTTVTIDVGF